jgi:N-glycosylase/DNA lyase
MSKVGKTVTHSFRLSERALKAIEEESKRQNVSVSTIINQQLLAYAEFERFFRRLGLIKISSATFQRLLEASPDDLIAKAGKEAGADTPSSIMQAKYGEITLDRILDYLEMLSEFANQFEFGRVEQGDKTVITLLHRLGPKGSIFFEDYVQSLFRATNYVPKIHSTDHSVVIEVSPIKEQNTY